MTKFLDTQVRNVSFQYLRDLATPRALAVYLMVKHGEWDQLATLAIDPHDYLDSEGDKFGRDAAATNWLRKCVDLPTSFDRKEAAWQTRASANLSCYKVNLRFRDYRAGYFSDEASARLAPFLREVGKIVRDTLGPIPHRLFGRFSPGVVIGKKLVKSYCLGDKMDDPITVSRDASEIFSHTWDGSAWERSRRQCRSIVIHDRAFEQWTTVPKDAKSDRGIAIQMLGNVYSQLGVGRHLRRRLRGVGIVLEEAQAKHRNLVVQASRSGDLSTIDLSSASDSISTEVVRALCGESWFHLLDSLRARTLCKEQRHYVNESFSSMGNGFTFELETIIFYAIAKAVVGEGEVRVYGDDIIVPSRFDSQVRAALRWFGFTVNAKKSFSTGYFRESCGQDAFNGIESRAAYLDKSPTTAAEWISLHNKLRGVYRRHSLGFHRVRSLVLNQIPTVARVFGPPGLGDLVLHHHDVTTWNMRVRNSIRYVSVWRPISRVVPLDHFTGGVQLAMALMGVPSSGIGYRNNVSGYRRGALPWS